jgi:hypothetical protein
MDTVLKSFSLGFLLRSLFAGVFFVLTYSAATKNTLAEIQVNAGNVFSFGLVFALAAGVTVYGIHRSAIYPWIEWALYADWAKKWREDPRLRLISKNVIDGIVGRWDAKAEGPARMRSRAEQINAWGDYIHLQYTSALCIVTGYATGGFVGRSCEMRYWRLFLAIAGFFAVFATASAWRSRSVEDHCQPVPPGN